MIRLASGHYLSPVGARRDAGCATIIETRYRAGMCLPQHAHEFVYMVVMVDGTLRERSMGRTHDLTRGWVVYNDAGECHDNLAVSPRTRCLNVELKPAFLRRLRNEATGPADGVSYRHVGSAMGAAGRLYTALIDPGPELEVEESLIELLGASFPGGHADAEPRWLPRVIDRLHAAGCDCPSLAELAAEAGVQHAHLCRTFRANVGCTIGEYVRLQRAGAALSAVTACEAGLASIALESGYSDQSHMTRELRARFGRPPRRLREAARKSASRS